MIKHVLNLAAILFLIAIALQSALAQEDEIYNRVIDLYRRALELYRRGVDVSRVVEKINNVVALVQNGSISIEEADAYLNNVSTELSILEKVGDQTTLLSIVKYSSIAAIVVLPIVFHIAFPRVYLYIWYRVRRGWFVRYGSSR